MTRRTTIILEDEVYNALVRESVDEYRTAKAISKVINELLKRAITNKAKVAKLIYSKKVAHVTSKEFEKFRGELSKAVEA